MKNTKNAWSTMLLALSLATAGNALAQTAVALTPIEALGQRIFTDRALSVPAGTACISCHAPNTGFASNNGSRIGVPLGSRPNSFGLRNAMSNAYNATIPGFSFRLNNTGRIQATGGHFWDGRAETLALQALGPFLNTAEMNNPNAAAVVSKVAASAYAPQFRTVFGATIFTNPTLAFEKIGVALAAFESSSQLQPFSSKFDAFVQKRTTLSASETRGMALFQDRNGANCVSCHRMNPASGNPRDSLFTDFSFHALGIPRNTAIPQNANAAFFDLGLCGPVRTRPALTANVPATTSIESFCGTFRMPSLRNVAQRQAFMHNGFFKDLRQVVNFYATRNTNPQLWYGPAGVPNDLPTAYVGNIINGTPPFNRRRAAAPVLSATEVDDVVAFLQTLSDGFVPAVTTAQSVAATPAPAAQVALSPF